MKEMCRTRCEQETTEQAYNLLKQQITYYNSSNRLSECCSFLTQPILKSIDSLPNIDIRQRLFNQYQEAFTKFKTNLFQLYMKSAEDERQEYKKKYEDARKKMWSNQEQSFDNNNNKRLSQTMIQLICQRCEVISQRIKCLYEFKMQSCLS